jgi:hypothetical protein
MVKDQAQPIALVLVETLAPISRNGLWPVATESRPYPRLTMARSEMESKMLVNIGKSIELDVNVKALPANALEHVIRMGLRNVLMDSHASITKETNPDDFAEVSKAVAEKKLAALMAGEVRVVSTREGDPIRAEAKRAAQDAIKVALRKAGRKAEPEVVKTALEKIMGDEARWSKYMETAKATIAARKSVDVDVDDLI